MAITTQSLVGRYVRQNKDHRNLEDPRSGERGHG
jgi:hypothetical protein